MNRVWIIGLAIAALGVPAFDRGAAAEVFLLENGGRLVGELLNPDEVPRETYVIRTPGGGQVTLAGSQVKEVQRQRPEEVEYEKLRPRYPDTVEGQWELAEWCREQRLGSQREVHLERILELDPDHEPARRALGYSRHEGEWKTYEQIMKERGYVLYRGRWMLPQRVRLLEGEKDIKSEQGNWKANVSRWSGWLGTDKHQEAYGNFAKITDPNAVPALADALDDPRDEARIIYFETLARIGSPEAIAVLAQGALHDPIAEVRLTCLDHLEKGEHPEAVRYFIAGLKSKDNHEINRAGVALRRMGDRSAVGPLIESLVTVHEKRVAAGNPGQMSSTFGTGPGGSPSGLSVGGGPKIVRFPVRNQGVLDALVALTGVSFDYDVARWRMWYAAQKRHDDFDSRRN
jgi:hypothetical protein